MHKTIPQSPPIVNPIIYERPDYVELTPNGIRFTRRYCVHEMKGGGKRGKVEGFSLASTRRLRELLFRCDFRPAGMGVLGLCFTLPPEAQNSDGEDVWAYMRKHPESFPNLVSLVWRKEVQRNGREHWHSVIWTSQPNPLPVAGALFRTWCKLVAKRCPDSESVERRMLWTHFRHFEAFFGPDLPASAVERVCALVPAITPIYDRNRAVQYLIDHTSKHKAYQANTKGRPWGVWGRDRLPRTDRNLNIGASMSKREGNEFARILRRLSRYPKRVPCVFGWRWYPGKRYLRGASILADAMAVPATRRLLEQRGIIEHATPPPPRPRRPVQPSLPLMGQEVCDSAAEVWEDWDKGRPVP